MSALRHRPLRRESRRRRCSGRARRRASWQARRGRSLRPARPARRPTSPPTSSPCAAHSISAARSSVLRCSDRARSRSCSSVRRRRSTRCAAARSPQKSGAAVCCSSSAVSASTPAASKTAPQPCCALDQVRVQVHVFVRGSRHDLPPSGRRQCDGARRPSRRCVSSRLWVRFPVFGSWRAIRALDEVGACSWRLSLKLVRALAAALHDAVAIQVPTRGALLPARRGFSGRAALRAG